MAAQGDGLGAAEDGGGGLDREADEVGPGGERGLAAQRLEGVDAGHGGEAGAVEERGDEQPRGAELGEGEEEVAAGAEEEFEAGGDGLEGQAAGIGGLEPAGGCGEGEGEFGGLGEAGLGGEGAVCEEGAGGLEGRFDGGSGLLRAGMAAKLGREGVGRRLYPVCNLRELSCVGARRTEQGDAWEGLQVCERVGDVDVAERGVDPDERGLTGGGGGDEGCELCGFVGRNQRCCGPGTVVGKGLGDCAVGCATERGRRCRLQKGRELEAVAAPDGDRVERNTLEVLLDLGAPLFERGGGECGGSMLHGTTLRRVEWWLG